MDYTHFFDFGVDAGDTQLNKIDDGSSPPISLPTPIQFFERSQSIIYVRWLCILSPMYHKLEKVQCSSRQQNLNSQEKFL